MKIQRTLPPASTVVTLKKLYHGSLGLFSGDKYKTRLTEEIKSYFDAKYVFPVSSGKAALYLVLKALKELSPEKNKVIVPAYTCFSVPSAILKAGLKVTPCDIDPETYDFDYELLEKSLDKDTLCVLSTHLFGIPSDVERIKRICNETSMSLRLTKGSENVTRRGGPLWPPVQEGTSPSPTKDRRFSEQKGVYVVEDAAQSMGGRYGGKLLGTIGDVGFFSLGRGKNITCGSGGIIITNSDIIAEKIKKEWLLLEDPGILNGIKELLMMFALYVFSNPFLYWFPSGLPFLGLGETVFHRDFVAKKLSGVKAGLLRYWQEELDLSNAVRRKNGSYLIDQLQAGNSADANYLRFPLLMRDGLSKKAICSISNERGLGISSMYPTPINEIEEIKEQFRDKSVPSAKCISDRLITIPTHHLVTREDLRNASDLVRGFN